MDTAMIQVLGAVAYGEWKAYEGAKAEAAAADDPALRRRHRGHIRRMRAVGLAPFGTRVLS